MAKKPKVISVSKGLEGITELTQQRDELVMEVRALAIRTFVDALYRRYQRRVKRHEFEGSFLVWLNHCEYLEHTFAKGAKANSHGYSMQVRKAWAMERTAVLFDDRLGYVDNKIHHGWVVRALIEEIDRRVDSPDMTIYVGAHPVLYNKPSLGKKLAAGMQLYFTIVDRPSSS